MSTVNDIPQPEQLPHEFIAAFAHGRSKLGRLGDPILYFSSVGSTNDVASALAAASQCDGAVVIAQAQTAGRGRRGRTWFSPAAAGLYVSVVLTPGRPADRRTALLTIAAGVGIAEGVQAATGFCPEIKWPNDLVVGRRKLAGILAEAVARSDAEFASVVLGYGINVSSAAYPPELVDRVTSLERELRQKIDPARVCVETLAALARRYEDLLDGRFDAILDAWLARSPGARGARVRWETALGPRTGITAGIDDSGALLVRVGEGTERLIAGEVNWV